MFVSARKIGENTTNKLNCCFSVLDKCKNMSKRKSNFGGIPKKYAQGFSTLGLKQLIKHPTRITYHTNSY